MSKISLNLSNDTIKYLSALAKENDATISEVARYLLAKGLAVCENEALAESHPVVPQGPVSKQAEL